MDFEIPQIECSTSSTLMPGATAPVWEGIPRPLVSDRVGEISCPLWSTAAFRDEKGQELTAPNCDTCHAPLRSELEGGFQPISALPTGRPFSKKTTCLFFADEQSTAPVA